MFLHLSSIDFICHFDFTHLFFKIHRVLCFCIPKNDKRTPMSYAAKTCLHYSITGVQLVNLPFSSSWPKLNFWTILPNT